MVSLNELRKPLREPELVAVYGKAEKDDVDAVMALGISRDRLICAAFKEVADQARRDTTMRTLISIGKKEVIKKKEVGDYPEYKEGTSKAEVLKYFTEHPDESYLVRELLDKFPDRSDASVQIAVSNLKILGVLGASSEYPARYFLKEKGDPELRAMLPTGTKAEAMR